MGGESDFIKEAQNQLGHRTASFVNILFFHNINLDSYTGSILPYQTQDAISYDTAFKFQHTIQQVVKLQESKGMSFVEQKIGIIVGDPTLNNAEMIADAVLGVFRAALADVVFSLATDRHTWVNTVTREAGIVTDLTN